MSEEVAERLMKLSTEKHQQAKELLAEAEAMEKQARELIAPRLTEALALRRRAAELQQEGNTLHVESSGLSLRMERERFERKAPQMRKHR